METAQLIKFCISGAKFMVLESELFQPRRSALLQKFAHGSSADRKKMATAYLEETGEYFFQRSPEAFASILAFYWQGHLHMPQNSICREIFISDLIFWQIPIDFISSCCLSTAYPPESQRSPTLSSRKQSRQESVSFNNNKKALEKDWNGIETILEETPEEKEAQEAPRMVDLLHFQYVLAHPKTVQEYKNAGGCRRKLRNFLEDPSSSKPAKILSVVSVAFIIVSVFGLVLGSCKDLQDKDREPMLFLQWVETICISWFTIEYLTRFIVYPRKWEFLCAPLNLIDLFSIIPYYMELIMATGVIKNIKGFMLVLQVLRIMRVARIMKLARHSGNLQSLGATITSSKKELRMLALYMGTSVLLFSTVMYYCEKDHPKTKFTSIPQTFWWYIVTMTTVGYGDMIPATIGGQFVGSIATLTGVVILAFPVTVIVTNFLKEHKSLQLHQAAASANNKKCGTKDRACSCKPQHSASCSSLARRQSLFPPRNSSVFGATAEADIELVRKRLANESLIIPANQAVIKDSMESGCSASICSNKNSVVESLLDPTLKKPTKTKRQRLLTVADGLFSKSFDSST